jgi:hypothetical protein
LGRHRSGDRAGLPVRGAGVGGDSAGIGPDNQQLPKKDGNLRTQGVGADLRRFVLRWMMAMQAITTIFLVEPTNVGWSVRIGDERLGSFSTQRQALDDVKNRRATLSAKGQRSTVVVTRHRSHPSKR